MEDKCKLSGNDIVTIESVLNSGKNVELRLDKDRNVLIYEIDKSIAAKG